jgi:ABC-type nitrate/sulfonate/bicarbonate transport system substrate-binding protein
MTTSSDSPTKVVVALDWTPNGNHLGFYVAKDLGFYESAGLDVRLVSPHDEAYVGSYVAPKDVDGVDSANAAIDPPYVTPCGQVADGSAHFGINSPEGVVNWNVTPGRPNLKAVAALLHDRNTSAIVTLRSSGIDTPGKLDGKVYASYAARFEGRIVQEMIRADGGKGDFTETTPPMLGIWNTLLAGEADATWVFRQWEGCEAELKGVDLNVFPVCDYGMPYAYAPCLCAKPEWLAENEKVARAFLAATARGYAFARDDPVASAAILVRLARLENDGLEIDPGLAQKSAAYLRDKFIAAEAAGAAGRGWGRMEEEVWRRYVAWLWNMGLLTEGTQSRHPDSGRTFSLDDLRNGNAGKRIPLESVPSVFTNEYLPE